MSEGRGKLGRQQKQLKISKFTLSDLAGCQALASVGWARVASFTLAPLAMLAPASFFEDLAQASPHIYFIYDLLTQRVVFVNPAYERLLGGHCALVNEELPALLRRLHPDDLPVWRHYWHLWTQGRLFDAVEFRLLIPGQAPLWLCLHPHWHQDTQGQRQVGGYLTDSSLAKQNQATIMEFNAKKNTVLQLLSHDLAGAFTMLQQLTDFVQEEMSAQANPKVPEMLTLMRTTSQQGMTLIHDLLQQEFVESTHIALKRERLDLVEWIKKLLAPYTQVPGNESRHLQFDAPATPVYAHVDINKLLQVVNNLVHNAFKFTPDAGRVTVILASFKSYVRISIADDGIGIAAHLLPHVFERYTIARRPGLRGEPTTGLGLWLCKTIVELHRGTLRVQSEQGVGTTFTLEIPV